MKMSDFYRRSMGHHFASIDQDQEDPSIVRVTYTDRTDTYMLNPDVSFDLLKDVVFQNHKNVKKIALLMGKNAMFLTQRDVDYKQVKCNSCGMVHNISADFPNTICPSCGEGVLEVV